MSLGVAQAGALRPFWHHIAAILRARQIVVPAGIFRNRLQLFYSWKSLGRRIFVVTERSASGRVSGLQPRSVFVGVCFGEFRSEIENQSGIMDPEEQHQ